MFFKSRTTHRFALLLAIIASPLTIGNVLAGQQVPRSHGPVTRKIISSQMSQPAGTIIISNSARTLDLVINANTVARYSVAIGREGFAWRGTVRVGRKTDWPDWRPPSDMRARDPSLPEMVPAGPLNPLGARALYLYKNGKDTLYRIHGTNDASRVGTIATSGCFRMTNADIIELYGKVSIGAKVIVND